MIDQCYNCCFADEYLAWWWYRICDPTCSKGEQMYIDENCSLYEQIGRGSR